MTRPRYGKGVVAALVLALVTIGTATASPAGTTARASQPRRTGTDDHGLVRLGPARPDAIVSLSLALQFPGTTELERYVATQQQTRTPIWLTPAQIGERFGLPTYRLDATTTRLAAAGITVTERFDQRTALLATGSVRSIEHFFHVRLDDFRTADGTPVRIPSRPPTIPASIADAVSGVDGLDTRPVFNSHAHLRRVTTAGAHTYLNPQQLVDTYGASKDKQIDGSGETVAIASLATTRGDEMAIWTNRFGSTIGSVRNVTVRPAAPTANSTGWDAAGSQEVALDLEMVRAVAPGAPILNYTTSNDGAGLDRIVNQVTQDRKTTTLTISWGTCELKLGGARIQRSEAAYAAAEAAGIDVFVASGDYGPYGCNDQTHQSDRNVSVDYPASSSHVIAVGGTTILHAGNPPTEQAWQDPQTIAGSVGGQSAYIRRPSSQLNSVVHSTGNARLVPDVAGPADNYLNLGVVIWSPQRSHFELSIAGGTSAASPFWAAAAALLKQEQQGNLTGGRLKPLLYKIASSPSSYNLAFHDVTTGSNSLFTASPGWDPITGLGTPNISKLESEIFSATP